MAAFTLADWWGGTQVAPFRNRMPPARSLIRWINLAVVGGLIGENDGTVSQSYSIGAVNGLGNIGGLIGGNNGTVTSSYWNTQTSGQSESDGGAPLTTAQFQSGLPSGFDATAWASGSNLANGYPYLLWQLPSNAFTVAGYIYGGGGAVAGGGISVYGFGERLFNRHGDDRRKRLLQFHSGVRQQRVDPVIAVRNGQ